VTQGCPWTRSALAARRRVGVGTARPTVDVTTVWTTAKCCPPAAVAKIIPIQMADQGAVTLMQTRTRSALAAQQTVGAEDQRNTATVMAALTTDPQTVRVGPG